MKQYLEIKSSHRDAILFFRMGDFYEMFFEDAVVASRELDLVLTSRDKNAEQPVPLAGIPHHAVEGYLARLISKGYKVAICEQTEDPRFAKGIVKRAVTRVVTPGTVLEDSLLSQRANNYLAAVCRNRKSFGLAVADVSTGTFLTTQLEGADADQRLLTEITRFKPAECIVPRELANDPELKSLLLGGSDMPVISHDPEPFQPDRASELVCNHFKVASVGGLGLDDRPLALGAAGAIISYVGINQPTILGNLSEIRPYSISDTMVLDATTLRNLELVRNIRDGSTKGTLLEVLDNCTSAMGSRLMRRWLLEPLLDPEAIERRLDGIEEIGRNIFLRQGLKDAISSVLDMERIVSRVVAGTANARDMVALRTSLEMVPAIQEVVRSADPSVKSDILTELGGSLTGLPEVTELLSTALVEEPPAGLKEGGLIRDGYSEELDEFQQASRDGKGWMKELEKNQRERTGIKNLRVRFNNVFGYFIEVTRSNLDLVPDDYVRKQTMANAERYITEELKEKESVILTAEEKLCALEYELFCKLREQVAQSARDIQVQARCIATLDILVSLAELALDRDYVRPEITSTDEIFLRESRHPVVECNLDSIFVPNDVELDCSQNQLVILTGPNMAGKSTYMRQIALCNVMAQMGSFVPAKYAKIGLVDRIFTRVGAYDDLTRGQSTFMVEMLELANILNSATDRSLILLDEIGRGTSTFDGLSIAWSVAEYIHDRRNIGAKTVFATHYHQLTELAEVLERVQNRNIAVKEDEGDIVFLRKVVPGGTNKSYGIQVGKLAGLPRKVLSRAEEILGKLEEDSVACIDDRSNRARARSARKGPRAQRHTQLLFFTDMPSDEEPDPPDPVVEELKDVDLNVLTPLEALNKLSELQAKARERREDNPKNAAGTNGARVD